MKAEEKELWQRYRAGRSEDALRALAEFYVPLMEMAAHNVANKIDYRLQPEELLGSGYQGLRRAIERYDPDRGVPFQGYAWTRIRGSILDYLREDVDELSRLERKKATAVNRARIELQRKGVVDPTSSDIAEYLGTDAEDVERTQALTLRVHTRWHLDMLVRGEEGTATYGSFLCNDVRAEKEQENIASIVEEGLAILPEKEAEVLRRHYIDGMKLKEVGRAMGLSESRACQLEKRALEYLRESAWYRRNNAA